MNKKQLNKGFSLVELAIVLVIIGVLMAMAMKGKTLIESARIKREIQLLRSFEVAVDVFCSIEDELPKYLGPNNDVLMDQFKVILPPTARKSTLVSGVWDFWVCTDYSANGEYWHNDILQLNKDRSVCAVMHDGSHGGPHGARPQSVYAITPKKLACHMERIIDDSDAKFGRGRARGITPFSVDTTNCNAEQGTVSYYWAIF